MRTTTSRSAAKKANRALKEEVRRLRVANMAMYDTALQFLEQMEKSSNPNRDAQAFKQAWITRDFEADACEAVGRDWLYGGDSSSDDDDDEASD